MDKSVVILKSDRVQAAISKYREKMGLDEKISPAEVCLHVILQVREAIIEQFYGKSARYEVKLET